MTLDDAVKKMRYSGKIDVTRCRADVIDSTGMWASSHQCERKWTVEYAGDFWCMAHAKVLKSAGGELPTTTYFVGGLHYGEPFVTQVEDDGVNLKSIALYGDYRIWSRDRFFKSLTHRETAALARSDAWTALSSKHEEMKVALKECSDEVGRLFVWEPK